MKSLDIVIYTPTRYTFFRQITTFIKVRVAFVFGLHILSLIDFSKIFTLKCLELKNNSHTNFYEHCDLSKMYIYFLSIEAKDRVKLKR